MFFRPDDELHFSLSLKSLIFETFNFFFILVLFWRDFFIFSLHWVRFFFFLSVIFLSDYLFLGFLSIKYYYFVLNVAISFLKWADWRWRKIRHFWRFLIIIYYGPDKISNLLRKKKRRRWWFVSIFIILSIY